MGLTKRTDSYYVEFRVLDNGKTLTLANGIQGARLKWKAGMHEQGSGEEVRSEDSH